MFCLTTPQSTFTHLRSLRRVNPSQALQSSDGGPRGGLALSGDTLRRYQWESAAFLGIFYATVVCMGWGLVGYLGMDHGGYEVNFLGSLPSADPWISFARVLCLIVLIPAVPLSLRPATTALFHLCRIPFVIHTASARRRRLRQRGSGVPGRKERERDLDAEWDDADEDEPLSGRKAWGARLVTACVWIGVAIGAIFLGGSNGGEGSTIEMLGCIGSTILTGILPGARLPVPPDLDRSQSLADPATFFVVLFHIRKARAIIAVADPRSPMLNDDLLLRKESQLQVHFILLASASMHVLTVRLHSVG